MIYWQLVNGTTNKIKYKQQFYQLLVLQEACEYIETHLIPIKIIQFQSSNVTVTRKQR